MLTIKKNGLRGIQVEAIELSLYKRRTPLSVNQSHTPHDCFTTYREELCSSPNFCSTQSPPASSSASTTYITIHLAIIHSPAYFIPPPAILHYICIAIHHLHLHQFTCIIPYTTSSFESAPTTYTSSIQSIVSTCEHQLQSILLLPQVATTTTPSGLYQDTSSCCLLTTHATSTQAYRTPSPVHTPLPHSQQQGYFIGFESSSVSAILFVSLS